MDEHQHHQTDTGHTDAPSEAQRAQGKAPGDGPASSMGHAGMDHMAMGHAGMGHAGMDHLAVGEAGTPHGSPSSMNHAGMDHAGMGHADMGEAGMPHGSPSSMDHAGMDHMAMAHAGMDHSGMVAQFRRLFWWMLALAVPTTLLSPMFAGLVGYDLPHAGGMSWVSPLLGTVIYVVGGAPFLTGALSEARSRRPGMMLLVALAITTAFLASWAATLGWVDHDLDFWWELALLVVIMLLGHWVEMRSLAQTSSALDSLAALLPDVAERVTGAGTESVTPSDLQVGDVVLVRPGGRVPADGVVTEGTAAVDESMVTGESRAVTRAPGDRVVAGTVSTDSHLRISVQATGEATALAGIRRLVAQAQESTSRTQRLADRAAGWLFWLALGAALVTALVWTTIGSPSDALTRAITVLVIACPHALGLAIPLVVAISTGRAASAGVLVTDRRALEEARRVDTVLFDKTGTLTRGAPEVRDVIGAGGRTPQQVLALAAAVESESEHPLARAIVRAAGAGAGACFGAGAGAAGASGAGEGGAAGPDGGGAAAPHGDAVAGAGRVPQATDIHSVPGQGVEGRVDGCLVAVGGPRLLGAIGAEPLVDALPWQGRGDTVLHVVEDGAVVGAIALADQVRPESAQAVNDLRARGIRVAIVTGDAEPVARAVAAELGIDEVHAGVLPADKVDVVAALRAKGRRVAFVGDGVNDAPALAGADVGIAIGAGTDAAVASAGVVLASDDPREVLPVIDLSRRAYRIMVENLWWAAGYNLVAIPLAAGVLAPIGFVMPMSIGALLMSASTVVVALNAQRMRRVRMGADIRSAEAGPARRQAPADLGGRR